MAERVWGGRVPLSAVGRRGAQAQHITSAPWSAAHRKPAATSSSSASAPSHGTLTGSNAASGATPDSSRDAASASPATLAPCARRAPDAFASRRGPYGANTRPVKAAWPVTSTFSSITATTAPAPRVTAHASAQVGAVRPTCAVTALRPGTRQCRLAYSPRRCPAAPKQARRATRCTGTATQ